MRGKLYIRMCKLCR